MTRAALLALLLLPLGCTVNALPGSASNRLGNGDGGGVSVDLGPGNHGDGGGCDNGGVDLGGGYWPDGGYWSDGGSIDAWFVDLGYGSWDAGPVDGGARVDLAR